MSLDIQAILARLPHRYPMLLVDRVTDIVPRVRITAIKNVTAAEPCCACSNDGPQAMPPSLIIEAMAQCAALFSFADDGDDERPDGRGVVYYFLGIDEARFLLPVVPGDVLRLEVRALRLGHAICKYEGRAYVADELVGHAHILCALRHLPETAAASPRVDALPA